MPNFAMTGTADFSQIEAKLQGLQTQINSLKMPRIDTSGIPSSFKTPTFDLRSAESAGLNMAASVEKGMVGGISGAMAKAESEIAGSMGRMKSTMLGSAGMFGSIAEAAGPIGIFAGALVGGSVLAEQAAERWQQANRKIANALRLDLQSADMGTLMDELQAARMKTGIDIDTMTGAAAGMASRVGKDQLADSTQSVAIWSTKWRADSASVAADMGNLGNSMKGKSEGWTEFIDKNGDAINALAKKYNTSGASILGAVNRLSPTMSRLGVKETSLPGVEALIASGSAWGLDETRVATMLNKAVASMQGKASVDLAKLVNVDTSTFENMLQTDLVGTVQKVSVAMAALPDKGAALMQKLGGAGGGTRDLLSLMGDPAKAKELADNLKLATDAFGSGQSATDAFGTTLDTAAGQMKRLGQVWDVTMEKLGKPLVSGVATTLAAITDTAVGLGTTVAQAMEGPQLDAKHLQMQVDQTGLLGQMGYGGEWDIGWDGIHRHMADTIKEGTKEGVEGGVEAAAPTVKASWKDTFDELTKAGVNELVAAMMASVGEIDSQGRSLVMGKYNSNIAGATNKHAAIAGEVPAWNTSEFYNAAGMAAQQTSDSNWGGKTALNTFGSFFETFKTMQVEGPGITSRLYIVDASGKEVAGSAYGAGTGVNFYGLQKKLEDSVRPAILNLPKYMKSVEGDISKSLEDIVSDGIVKGAEKAQLKDLLSGLDMLADKYPVEFSAANLPELRDNVAKTFYGIPITFDTGEAETNFAIWLQDHADEFVKMAKETGQIATEPEQKRRHEFEIDKSTSERSLMLLGKIDEAVKSGDVTQIGTLPEITDEFEKLNPQVATSTWYIQLMQTATKEYTDQVKGSGSVFKVLDESGKSLGLTDLRTAVASDILGGSLLRAADAANTFAGRAATSGILSAGNNQWAQSRISDAKYASTSGIGSNISTGSLGLSAFAAKTDSAFTGLSFTTTKMGFKLPGLKGGGKVPAGQGGLVEIGEGGETEYVITESQLQGLYPHFAKAEKGSMQYLTGEKMFEDYPGATITKPVSYQWSHYPNPPTVAESNTQYKQTAWLSDKQTTSLDMISDDIRAMQLASIGKSQVMPWFARGEIPQPKWWSEAVSKLSPQYASAWEANKGGTVPKIVADPASMISDKVSSLSAWDAIYDNSGTCIAFVEPDPSLKFTPGKSQSGKIDKGAWNAVYDNSGTCIAYVEPDKSLKFTPSKQSSLGAMGIQGFDMGNPFGQLTIGTGTPGALVTGLSKEGYIATYDPRTDTCEGLSFVAPDASLKTTDKFYLGLSQNNPYRSEDKSPGYGWENVATPANEDLAQLMKIDEQAYKDQQQATKDTAKTQKNTEKMATDVGAMVNGGTTSGGLVVGGGGGGGTWGSHGGTGGSYGSYFGGWLSGGAAGVSASPGAHGSNAGWMNTGASAVGGSGAIQWAEGGFANQATLGMFGEKGREAFVPISDRAAGLRILPQVMRELGVRQFATGGFTGGNSINAAIGPSTINLGGIVIQNAKNLNEKQLAKEITRQIEAKFYKDRKR
jgi:hypothetical protein